MTTRLLTGHTEDHLCAPSDAERLGVRAHRDVVEPFRKLQDDARREGFDLQILSGFRSFADQLSIWNRKASGRLAVLDSGAAPLDIRTLNERDLVFAILRWSALPGASRHHWGTDLDVYDAASTPDGYEIELVPEEVEADGMFGPMHEWLDARMATDDARGFYRPYDEDRQGVAPERWHLSHAPVAAGYLTQLRPDVLRAVVARADLRLKDTVLAHLDEIHERFVTNVGTTSALDSIPGS